MIDCGLFQGESKADEKNADVDSLDWKGIVGVIVTHAHIDHVGRLPLLTKAGFSGPLWATPATCDLAPIMLKDAGHLQEADAERQTRKALARGGKPVAPLFTENDAQKAAALFRPVPLDEWKPINPNIRFRFREAGHILGSASIEIEVVEDGVTKRIAWAGDIGQRGVPLMRDPVPPFGEDGPRPDLVVMESTYGDRDHRPFADTLTELERILREAVWSKEKVLIPAFAVGRTQLLLSVLHDLADSGRVPRFPIYLDSPMGIAATKLYNIHCKTLDEEAACDCHSGDSPMDAPGLILTPTPQESRALNEKRGASVIIAGSGMATGGRIVHHLFQNLPKPDASVLIVGYQGLGTLGRRLVDGEKTVKIFGEIVPVRAKVYTIGGLSAHGGQSDLVWWAGSVIGNGKANSAGAKATGTKPRFILTHGEDGPRRALAQKLSEVFGVSVALPAMEEAIEL